MPECIFCKVVAGEIPAKKVYESDHVIAFEDINAVAPIHLLIIPKKHIATLNDVAAQDETLLGNMFGCATQLARENNLAAPGYRLVMNCNAGAGQTVFHIHLHLLGGRAMQWPPG